MCRMLVHLAPLSRGFRHGIGNINCLSLSNPAEKGNPTHDTRISHDKHVGAGHHRTRSAKKRLVHVNSAAAGVNEPRSLQLVSLSWRSEERDTSQIRDHEKAQRE
jgi:hypothetical protein